MFSDMYLVWAWFGFIFLMLLFRVPFFLADGKSHPWRRFHLPHLLPYAPGQRHLWRGEQAR